MRACLCITCVLCPRRPEEAVEFPGNTDSCELPCGCWESKAGALEGAVSVSKAISPAPFNYHFELNRTHYLIL